VVTNVILLLLLFLLLLLQHLMIPKLFVIHDKMLRIVLVLMLFLHDFVHSQPILICFHRVIILDLLLLLHLLEPGVLGVESVGGHKVHLGIYVLIVGDLVGNGGGLGISVQSIAQAKIRTLERSEHWILTGRKFTLPTELHYFTVRLMDTGRTCLELRKTTALALGATERAAMILAGAIRRRTAAVNMVTSRFFMKPLSIQHGVRLILVDIATLLDAGARTSAEKDGVP